MQNNLAINIAGVTKEYPGSKALDDVTFEVKKGDIHGLLGPNGAGKSTVMKIMAGLTVPTAGVAEVTGKVGFLPERPPLYYNMKVVDYLVFVSKIYSINSQQCIYDEEVIEKCGLNQVANRMIGNLSLGFRQRVGIAQALIFKPDVVILDEPTLGLDPTAIVEIRQLISALKGDHTILLSSHQLHEVQQICNAITIIHQGRVLQTGSIEEIQKRFQTQQQVEAIVGSWGSSIQSELLNQLPIESIQVTHQEDGYHLNIFSSEKDDLRRELGQFLVKRGSNLIGLREKNLDLEDIFQLATAKGVDKKGVETDVTLL